MEKAIYVIRVRYGDMYNPETKLLGYFNNEREAKLEVVRLNNEELDKQMLREKSIAETGNLPEDDDGMSYGFDVLKLNHYHQFDGQEADDYDEFHDDEEVEMP